MRQCLETTFGRPSVAAAAAAADRPDRRRPPLLGCKIRIQHTVAQTVRYAQMLAAAGCQVLCIHARTKEQRGRGLARWSHIRAVQQAVDIVVIANGNTLVSGFVLQCQCQYVCLSLCYTTCSHSSPILPSNFMPACLASHVIPCIAFINENRSFYTKFQKPDDPDSYWFAFLSLLLAFLSLLLSLLLFRREHVDEQGQADVAACFSATDVDAVMVGETALHNPYIFRIGNKKSAPSSIHSLFPSHCGDGISFAVRSDIAAKEYLAHCLAGRHDGDNKNG